jgi:hypothetical protein
MENSNSKTWGQERAWIDYVKDNTKMNPRRILGEFADWFSGI